MTSGNSASHSSWLTFMYPRLFLANELLADRGLIFISIDDIEVSHHILHFSVKPQSFGRTIILKMQVSDSCPLDVTSYFNN